MRGEVPRVADIVAASRTKARALVVGVASGHAAALSGCLFVIFPRQPWVVSLTLTCMFAAGIVTLIRARKAFPRRVTWGSMLDWNVLVWGGRIPRVALRTLSLPEYWVHVRWLTYAMLLWSVRVGAT